MEVAGLALGVVPLVLSALDYYQQGMTLFRRYKAYRREFKMIHTSLRLESFKYKEVLTKVLSQSFQDFEIKKLLEEPTGEMWERPDNLERLRRQLGDEALEIFLVKADDFYLTVEEFKDRLGVERINLQNPNLFEEHYKRLRFSLAKKDYEDLLNRLRQNNTDLDVLTRPTTTQSQPRGNAYPATYVESVRECVKSTYTSLKSHWKCRCRQLHRVILRLGQPDHTQNSPIYGDNSRQPCFHIIFDYGKEQDPQTNPCPWSWRELNLLSKPDDLPQCSPAKPTPLGRVNTADISLLQNRAIQSCKRKKKPKLRFADDEDQADTPVVSMAALAIRHPALDTHRASEQITCICGVLAKQSCGQSPSSLGYMVDLTAQKRHDLIPLKFSKQPNTAATLLSLNEVLLHQTCSQRVLPRRLRMRLAAILSMSVLEYGQTPWSDGGWSRRDILFIQQEDTPSCEDMYIAESMASDKTGLHSQSAAAGLVRNKALFALGILLIELCFGKPAEDICQIYGVPSIVESDGSPKYPPDYNNLKVLLQAVAGESDESYGAAVRRCLHCAFDCSEDTLDFDEFRRAVYNEVIMPLEDNYRHMSGQNIRAVHSAR